VIGQNLGVAGGQLAGDTETSLGMVNTVSGNVLITLGGNNWMQSCSGRILAAFRH